MNDAAEHATQEHDTQEHGTQEQDRLWHVLYVSREAYEMEASDMLKLLFDARDHNRRAGITGLLLHHGHRFMQLLEGPRTRVEPLFARIAEDARHSDVTVESAGPLAERLFADWTMGFADIPTLHGRSALANVESEAEALEVLRVLGSSAPCARRMLDFLGDGDITLRLR